MRKLIISTAVIFVFSLSAYCAGVTGLWQTVDDETGKPKSIVAIYEKDGVMFGKIILTYNEDGSFNTINKEGGLSCCNTANVAEKMPGKPSYCGLVFIKDMKPTKDGKFSGGTITDPKKGKTYKAEMWLEGTNLIVRGKLGPFGRNQTWLPFSTASLPKGITE